MFKRQIFILVISILFISCNSSNIKKEIESSKTDEVDYFKLVDDEFTGDLAYKTTAFI
ncbi:MAG: hypothetical protein QNK89_06235 [Lacinutrix sp.]|uniref:hypothetical protein n=1 Tax=Lacinutrix sp. TaxID=1937692 RepID=UPI0030A2910D